MLLASQPDAEAAEAFALADLAIELEAQTLEGADQ
jgi:hypothetical protein